MSRASVRWSLDDLRGYRERLSARANNSTDLAGSVARASSTIDPVADLAVTRAALDAGYAPLVGMCRAAGLPEPVPEWVFHPTRRWRFDYAFVLHKLALEVEGGQWVNGRHNRGSGQIADLEKYSEAAILGWRVLYATPEQIRSGVAMDRIIRALGAGRTAA